MKLNKKQLAPFKKYQKAINIRLKKYENLVAKNQKSIHTETRLKKIKILKEQRKKLKSIISKKKITKKAFLSLKELELNFKNTKRIKKPDLKIEKDKINFLALYDKYQNLLNGNSQFNKGLLYALQDAGLLPYNMDELTYDQLLELEEMLNIEGLSWDDIQDIIIHNYSEDIDYIFYIAKTTQKFNANYFRNSVKEMIDLIKKDRDLELKQGYNPADKLYREDYFEYLKYDKEGNYEIKRKYFSRLHKKLQQTKAKK